MSHLSPSFVCAITFATTICRLSYHTSCNNYRYALDVNIATLDVLNHKRLLDSARSDPSAVSFQVRPVDVMVGTATDPARKPSFGSLEAAQHLVRRSIRTVSHG